MVPALMEAHRARQERLERMGGAQTNAAPRVPTSAVEQAPVSAVEQAPVKPWFVILSDKPWFTVLAEGMVPLSPDTSPESHGGLRIADIQRLVAQHFDVKLLDLKSARRTANIVRPRQIAMYLARKLTSKSLPEIGRRTGGRDHTTVLHAVTVCERILRDEEEFAPDIRDLFSRLECRAS